MPQAVKLTSKTKMLVSIQIDLPIQDVEAMLDNALAAKKNHGDCYVVIDYVDKDGKAVDWSTMHRRFFEDHFRFSAPENANRFVYVTAIKNP